MKRLLLRWRSWLLLAAAMTIVGAYLAWGLAREHERLARFELGRLATQSGVVEVNLTRQLEIIDATLKKIQQDVPDWLQQPGGRHEAVASLQSMTALMPSVRVFLVTDARGTVILSSHAELMGRNFFQRDYVQVPLKTLKPELLYVSQPFKTVLDSYSFTLAHVRLDDRGGFAGVVVASMEPEDVGILLNSVRYTDDVRVSLAHGNGEIFISVPAEGGLPGENLSTPGSVFARHLQSGQAVSLFDGRQRATPDNELTVVRTVSPAALHLDKPLVVVLSRPSDVLFEGWQRDARNQAVACLLLVLVSAWGLFVWRRQRLQKSLAAKRLALASAASGVGIWEFDLVTKRYHWDAVMFNLFGLDPQQASPRNNEWWQLLSAADLVRMREATRRTIQQSLPFDMTFAVRRKDGSVRVLRNRAALHVDDYGVPRRLIGATEDVTERKQREADLRVAAAAFESHESMIVTNAQMEILRVNQAFCALFGYAASEVIGRNPRLLKSGRHDAEFYHTFWDELQARHSWRGEIWNVRKNGEEFPCWMSITAVCDDEGVVTHYVATHTDITQRKAAEDEVKRLAFYDPLTNLPNRRLLTDRLKQAVSQAKRNRGHLALLFVDLDKFKPVNDAHGHAAGDMLMQEVALRLRACVRESDTVARVGGDEFVLLLNSIGAAHDALMVAEKIQTALRQPFALAGDVTVRISSSVGVALYPEHGSTEAELSHNADVAMYAAKAAGRDRVMLPEPTEVSFDSTPYRYECIP